MKGIFPHTVATLSPVCDVDWSSEDVSDFLACVREMKEWCKMKFDILHIAVASKLQLTSHLWRFLVCGKGQTCGSGLILAKDVQPSCETSC